MPTLEGFHGAELVPNTARSFQPLFDRANERIEENAVADLTAVASGYGVPERSTFDFLKQVAPKLMAKIEDLNQSRNPDGVDSVLADARSAMEIGRKISLCTTLDQKKRVILDAAGEIQKKGGDASEYLKMASLPEAEIDLKAQKAIMTSDATMKAVKPPTEEERLRARAKLAVRSPNALNLVLNDELVAREEKLRQEKLAAAAAAAKLKDQEASAFKEAIKAIIEKNAGTSQESVNRATGTTATGTVDKDGVPIMGNTSTISDQQALQVGQGIAPNASRAQQVAIGKEKMAQVDAAAATMADGNGVNNQPSRVASLANRARAAEEDWRKTSAFVSGLDPDQRAAGDAAMQIMKERAEDARNELAAEFGGDPRANLVAPEEGADNATQATGDPAQRSAAPEGAYRWPVLDQHEEWAGAVEETRAKLGKDDPQTRELIELTVNHMNDATTPENLEEMTDKQLQDTIAQAEQIAAQGKTLHFRTIGKYAAHRLNKVMAQRQGNRWGPGHSTRTGEAGGNPENVAGNPDLSGEKPDLMGIMQNIRNSVRPEDTDDDFDWASNPYLERHNNTFNPPEKSEWEKDWDERVAAVLAEPVVPNDTTRMDKLAALQQEKFDRLSPAEQERIVRRKDADTIRANPPAGVKESLRPVLRPDHYADVAGGSSTDRLRASLEAGRRKKRIAAETSGTRNVDALRAKIEDKRIKQRAGGLGRFAHYMKENSPEVKNATNALRAKLKTETTEKRKAAIRSTMAAVRVMANGQKTYLAKEPAATAALPKQDRLAKLADEVRTTNGYIDQARRLFYHDDKTLNKVAGDVVEFFEGMSSHAKDKFEFEVAVADAEDDAASSSGGSDADEATIRLLMELPWIETRAEAIDVAMTKDGEEIIRNLRGGNPAPSGPNPAWAGLEGRELDVKMLQELPWVKDEADAIELLLTDEGEEILRRMRTGAGNRNDMTEQVYESPTDEKIRMLQDAGLDADAAQKAGVRYQLVRNTNNGTVTLVDHDGTVVLSKAMQTRQDAYDERLRQTIEEAIKPPETAGLFEGAEDEFGLGGAAKATVNYVGDAVFGYEAFPENSKVRTAFRELSVGVSQAMSRAYETKGNVPLFLQKKIDDLTPSPGVFFGPELAKAKLLALSFALQQHAKLVDLELANPQLDRVSKRNFEKAMFVNIRASQTVQRALLGFDGKQIGNSRVTQSGHTWAFEDVGEQ